MTINGRRILDLPCAIMAIFGIDLFTPKNVSLRCIFLLVLQISIVMTTVISLKDFRTLNADIWVTCAAASQVSI